VSRNRFAVAASVAVTLGCVSSCTHREPRPLSRELRSSAAERGYIDLQPGWTVQVVFPKLRSGGYVLPSMQNETEAGSTIDLHSTADFLGYEKDFYRVSKKGVSVDAEN